MTVIVGQSRPLVRRLCRGDGTFILSVCLLSVLVRLPLLMIDVAPTSDFGWYFDRAKEIAAGAGYAEGGVLTAFWPVGWPGFLGGLLRLFGPHVVVGQCANLVLSTLNVCLVAAIGRRLFPSSGVWRLAALLIAVLPNQIGYVPLLSVEIFFEFLLLLGFLMMLSQSSVALLAAGLVFGVAALTKSQAVFLPVLIALPLLIFRAGWRGLGAYVRTVALTSVAMMVVIVPWITRNYTVFDAFIPISTNGGYTLLTGNNPSARGGFTPGDTLVADLSTDPRNQVQTDRVARERAWHWIEQNKVAFLKLIPAKVWLLWSGDGEAEWMYQKGYRDYETYRVLFRAVRALNQMIYWVVLGLSIVSLPALLRRRRSLPVWSYSGWCLMAYFTMISIVFSGQSRFHFALMPFIALYAAWAVTSGGAALATRRESGQMVSTWRGRPTP